MTIRPSTRFFAQAVALLFAGLLAIPALSASALRKSATEAKIDHLTDLIVETVPLGEDMEAFMRTNDYWPRRSAPRDGDYISIRCLRDAMNSEGTFGWNRSLIELTNTRRERRQR